MGKNPFNASSVRDGTSQKVVPIKFKLHEGRDGQGTSLPSQGRDKTASFNKSRHPPIIFKISKVLQKYHNPGPIARLIGPANETKVQIEGKSYLALIDSRVQLSA